CRLCECENLVARAPLGVSLGAADFRNREVNPVAMPVFGDVPGGVIGRDFDEVIHAIREKTQADNLVGIFRKTLETGQPYISPGLPDSGIDRDTIEGYEWRLDRITLPDGR